MTGLIIVLVVVAILVFYVIGIYNSLVRLRNQVKNAWSQIDVQLKRRHDLIPNLIETVKGYMKHERETLDSVTQARAAAMGAQTVGEKAKAESMLRGKVSRPIKRINSPRDEMYPVVFGFALLSVLCYP